MLPGPDGRQQDPLGLSLLLRADRLESVDFHLKHEETAALPLIPAGLVPGRLAAVRGRHPRTPVRFP
jgi:hypothetical protein